MKIHRRFESDLQLKCFFKKVIVSMKKQQGQIILQVNKDNPKPDAHVHEIRTIEEMFNILTPDNVEQFLKEAGVLIRLTVLTKSLGKKKTPFIVDKITWIED
jgi:hypothetical protein